MLTWIMGVEGEHANQFMVSGKLEYLDTQKAVVNGLDFMILFIERNAKIVKLRSHWSVLCSKLLSFR